MSTFQKVLAKSMKHFQPLNTSTLSPLHSSERYGYRLRSLFDIRCETGRRYRCSKEISLHTAVTYVYEVAVHITVLPKASICWPRWRTVAKNRSEWKQEHLFWLLRANTSVVRQDTSLRAGSRRNTTWMKILRSEPQQRSAYKRCLLWVIFLVTRYYDDNPQNGFCRVIHKKWVYA